MPGCQLRRDTRAMETDGVLRSLLGSPHHNHATMTTTAVVELPTTGHPRLSILDTCHRKIRLLGGGPVAFFGGLVAKARRKDKEPSTPCPDDPKLYLEEAVLERKLPDIDLRVLVDLPAGLDYNEWLASHTIAFFDHINLVYGTISEFCTMSGCPDMTGPGLRTYLWFDDKGKKTRVAAPQYIDYVMTFTQKTISDESIFPTKYANEFPSSFESIVRKILRLLFHVLAHLYHCHFREVVLLNLHAHLNCVFAHLTLFNHRFQLIELKETEILQDLVLALKVHSDGMDSSCEEGKKCDGLDGDAAASVEGLLPSADASCNTEDRNDVKPDLILTSTTVLDISSEERDVRSCEIRDFCQDDVGSGY